MTKCSRFTRQFETMFTASKYFLNKINKAKPKQKELIYFTMLKFKNSAPPKTHKNKVKR